MIPTPLDKKIGKLKAEGYGPSVRKVGSVRLENLRALARYYRLGWRDALRSVKKGDA